MVHYLESSDILAICKSLCETQKPKNAANWPLLEKTLYAYIEDFATKDAIRYLPRHKWLEFVAGCVEEMGHIAKSTQLHPHEARAMLSQAIGENSLSFQKFQLEAALEQARYEPIMLLEDVKDEISQRKILLQKRWEKMKAAQQAHAPLPQEMMQTLNQTVENAIQADCFANYRTGPMLQFFAEMLHIAYNLNAEGQAFHDLQDELSPNANLWRRHMLKSGRFAQEEEDYDNVASSPLSAFTTDNRPVH